MGRRDLGRLSREHGDLRVPHFIGLHAVQLRPAIAWLIGPLGSALRRRRAVLAASAGYLALFAILLAQALSGQPVLAPHGMLLAGWVHYLAFDLFIGAWETRDAMARRVPRLLLAPCLVMTFMLGPIGLLCYHIVRARMYEPLDRAVLAPVSKAH